MYDRDTKRYFDMHPNEQTTVVRCDVCGKYYKPSLEHKCNKKQEKVDYVPLVREIHDCVAQEQFDKGYAKAVKEYNNRLKMYYVA